MDRKVYIRFKHDQKRATESYGELRRAIETIGGQCFGNIDYRPAGQSAPGLLRQQQTLPESLQQGAQQGSMHDVNIHHCYHAILLSTEYNKC